MTLPENRKYYRPCGQAFNQYGGDLNVQAFGDRLSDIDDALYAADVIIDRLRDALIRIAAFDDEGANERLKRTGSYGAFDEPGSVEIAREALK